MANRIPILSPVASAIRGVAAFTRGGWASLIASFAMERSGGASGAIYGRKGRPANPYRVVAAVRSVVARKANALASMPLRFATADDQLIESGDLVDLADHPNPFQSATEFMRATSAFLDLTGECHWIFTSRMGSDASGRGGRPVEIVPVGAVQMQPIYGPNMALDAWYFTPWGVNGLAPRRIELDELWTLRLPAYDVLTPWRGCSPVLESAGAAMAQVYKADLANESSLDNGVEPGGAFVFPPGSNLTDDQISKMKRDLEERHGGPSNRNRNIVLYGGADWKTIARAFDEMEFSKLKQMSIKDICAALDVDPAAVGYTEDANFGYMEAAKASFWVDTTVPRGMWIADEFHRGVVSRYQGVRTTGMTLARKRALDSRQKASRSYRAARDNAGRTDDGIFCWFDSSRVPAVQQAELARAEQAGKWIDKGVPLNEVIAKYDLPFEPQPWGNTWYKPIGQADVREDTLGSEQNQASGGTPGSPASSKEEPSNLPPEETLPGEEGEEEETIAGDGEAEYSEEIQEALKGLTGCVEYRKISQKDMARVWMAWRASWGGLEKSVRNRVASHMLALRSECLAKLAKLVGKGMERKDAELAADEIGRVLFDIVEADKSLLVRVRPLLRQSLRLGGEQAIIESASPAAEGGADSAAKFNMSDPGAISAMRKREIKITGINRTVKDSLRSSLADGIKAGETGEELAQRVKDVTGIAARRARTVARTEVGAAVESGRDLGRKQAGVPLKSWLSSRKKTSRPNHLAMEAQTMETPIPEHEQFVLPETGGKCLYPRDSTLAAVDVVNCACMTVGRYPGDGLRAVIGKLLERGFLTPDNPRMKV